MPKKAHLQFLALVIVVIVLSLSYTRVINVKFIISPKERESSPPHSDSENEVGDTTPKPTEKPVTYNTTEICESPKPDLSSFTNNVSRKLIDLSSQPRQLQPNCTLQLAGRFVPDKTPPASYRAIEARYPDVQPGGAWRPSDCSPRSRIAVVVPYRDREEHLRVFLNVMHGFLQKQKLEYRIFVIEQTGKAKFNRATLLNIGVYEALRMGGANDSDFGLSDFVQLADVFLGRHGGDDKEVRRLAGVYSRLRDTFDCFVLHDVDLVPENDRQPYSCPVGGPRQLVIANEKDAYKPIYDKFLGSASILGLEQLLRINGNSNMYFGWGGEDDELSNRVRLFWKISRCPPGVGRYSALSHRRLVENETNVQRFELLAKWARRWQTDGLNSLQNCKFRVESRVNEPLFTRIVVHFDVWPIKLFPT